MQKGKKMLLFIIVFLSCALAFFVTATAVFAARCNYLHDQISAYAVHEEQLIADKKTLLNDKKELINRNSELYADNVQLTAAIRELKAVNKELTNTAPVVEEPQQEIEQTTSKYLPENYIPTNMFRCEPYQIWDEEKKEYKSAFVKGSEQRALQDECFTDNQTGIRYWSEESGEVWCCAALAGAYGCEIGQCYIFTLRNGYTIPVIMADFKHPIDNIRADDYGDDDVNYDGQKCINVIEFVIDMAAALDCVKQAGTMSALECFGGLYGNMGDIVNVEPCGRRWRP
jgi:hypothetical protein